MKVAIVGFEDFREIKTLRKAIESALNGIHPDVFIPYGSCGFIADLRAFAKNLGGVISESPSRGNKGLREIAQVADLCLAFTSNGFAPEGKAFRVVQKFSDFSKPVNVMQIDANGDVRKIMKLRHYKAANRVKSISVMIVSSPVDRARGKASRKSG